MKKYDISTFLKGLIIGGTMIVPGVSGGTMAMILGIYDKLIFAISSFRRAPLQNFLTLIKFVTGAGIGILLFASPISWLLENYEMLVIYFFMGAVFGGIPLIEQKSGIQRFSAKAFLYMAIGTVIVLVISKIPKDVFSINGNLTSLLIVGSISAVALILPGISISHLFLILGMYEEILNALKTLNLAILFPLAVGVGIGIVLFSKLLGKLMEQYPKQTYLIILGFILGSVAGIFPGVPTGTEKGAQIIICAALLILGFLIIFKIQNKFES